MVARLDSADSATVVKSVVPLFDKSQPFEIVKSTRGLTPQASVPDTTRCNGWIVEDKAIKKIITQSEPLTGPDWHHLFNVLPCVIQGEIVQEGVTFGFEVNAGSWTYISSKDTTLMLGSFKKENEKFFLSPAITQE
jgi:hypothetical protein